ncbi:hypothetical protein [Streptomyces sp. A5-4]|uniref:hypothetical protein n=1 Tax=Streptomyces sp. A5-4 TaxID=3384771 RepID=UPI003DA8D15C
MPHHNLTAFVHAVGTRLPGRWQAEAHPTSLAEDPASDRIWNSGPLAYTAHRSSPTHRSVLTSASGIQLYVTEHPSRKSQFVVAPMLPAGTKHDHTAGVAAPKAVTVPADPVRAAALVRRRQLFDYRVASMMAQSRAGAGPHLPVDITLGTDGRPRVTTVYARALYELLGREGFLLDPASGKCYLPETVEDPIPRTRQAAQRLADIGFSPTFPEGDNNAASASGTQGFSPSAPAGPPPLAPARTHRAPR